MISGVRPSIFRSIWIEVMPFFKAKETIDVKMILERGQAHGGGDAVLSREFGDLVAGIADCPTTLRESLECHLMGIAAEESRKADA